MKWILRTLALVALIPLFAFLWYYLGFGVLPETVGTVKVNTLDLYEFEKNEEFEDKTFFLELNYLNNKNGNGKELFEIMFSTYLGTDTTNIFSKGIQLFGEKFNFVPVYEDYQSFGFLGLEHKIAWYTIKPTQEIFFYDQSYETEDKEPFSIANSLGLSDGHSFMVSVNNTPLKLNFKGKEKLEQNTLDRMDNFLVPTYCCLTIDTNFFIYHLLENVKSLDEGTHIVTLDLSTFFDCYLYNEETMQYDKLTADTQFTYIQAKINIENSGCVNDEQSMFKMIANNQDDTVKSESGLFWKTVNNITLTNESFENINGYLVLKTAVATKLLEYEDIRVKVNITLDDTIKGFDKDCFLYLEDLNSIKISSDKERTFEIFKYSIQDNVKIELDKVIIQEVENG